MSIATGTRVPTPRTPEHRGLRRDELPAEARPLFDQLRARDTDPAFADALRYDGYARISLNRATGETDKTDRQIVTILSSMIAAGVLLGEIFRDDNMSAWKLTGKRKGWNAAVARIAARISRGLYVAHVDRMTRQPTDCETLLKAAEDGAFINSPHGDFNLVRPMDKFMLRGMVNQANMQSDETSRRIKTKMAADREAGRRHGGTRPFGEASGPYSQNAVSAETVEAERAAIRWAVDAFLSDQGTLAEIARKWTALGLATKTGLKLNGNRVRQILEQPRLAGLLTHNGEVIGRRTDFEPIITEDAHRQIIAVLKSRRRGRPLERGSSPLSLGVLVCGRCGKPLSGKVTERKTGLERQYRCSPGSGCGRVAIKADAIEPLIRGMVITTLFGPEHAATVGRASEALGLAREKAATAKARLKSMSVRWANEEMTLDEWDGQAPILRKRVKDAEAKVIALESARIPSAELPAYVWTDERETVIKALHTRWTEGGPDVQRAMTREAFQRIIVHAATSTRQAAHERLEYVEWT